MLKLQHPNVVDFFGYAFKLDKPPLSGSDHEPLTAEGYLVMELMEGGDLRDEIDRLVLKQFGRPFLDDVAVDILLQIVGAMSHMHDCDVLYRDLKAKNCMVRKRSSSRYSSKLY
jgi:serine/threonine protein kinase